jgi:histone H3/H4
LKRWDGKTGAITDVIIKAAVRDATDDLNVGGDFYDALNEEVQALLTDTARRANANGRKTVQARDL